MTAVIGHRSLQEEEADGGNISAIRLMECLEGDVPVDEEQTPPPSARRTTQRRTVMRSFLLLLMHVFTSCSVAEYIYSAAVVQRVLYWSTFCRSSATSLLFTVLHLIVESI